MSPRASAQSPSQWSWKWANWAGGNGSAASSSPRGNSDAAPVIAFATSSEVRSSWLFSRRSQYVAATSSPSGRMTRASLYTSSASPSAPSSTASLSGCQTSSWSASATWRAPAGASASARSKLR